VEERKALYCKKFLATATLSKREKKREKETMRYFLREEREKEPLTLASKKGTVLRYLNKETSEAPEGREKGEKGYQRNSSARRGRKEAGEFQSHIGTRGENVIFSIIKEWPKESAMAVERREKKEREDVESAPTQKGENNGGRKKIKRYERGVWGEKEKRRTVEATFAREEKGKRGSLQNRAGA